MTPRELEEFKALRATIRERGTARVWVFLAGLTAWAGLTVATAALAALPVASFLPLLVLAGTFEAVFSLHVGVERIGRYIQVFLEESPGWEQAAMGFGRPARAAVTDPLFTLHFILAAVLNYIPVLLVDPVRLELLVVGGGHLIVIARLLLAKSAAGRQRAVDTERFKALRNA
jgi:hypothetical protein